MSLDELGTNFAAPHAAPRTAAEARTSTQMPPMQSEPMNQPTIKECPLCRSKNVLISEAHADHSAKVVHSKLECECGANFTIYFRGNYSGRDAGEQNG
jgi:hypothetical protein